RMSNVECRESGESVFNVGVGILLFQWSGFLATVISRSFFITVYRHRSEAEGGAASRSSLNRLVRLLILHAMNPSRRAHSVRSALLDPEQFEETARKETLDSFAQFQRMCQYRLQQLPSRPPTFLDHLLSIRSGVFG